MTEDIQKAIEKNLPAAVGTELQKRLARTDALERELESSKARCDKYYKDITELDHLRREKEQIEKDRECLEKDKLRFEILQRDTHIKLLKEKYDDVRSLMHDVFRNQQLVWKTTSSTTHNGHYNDNNQWVPDHHSHTDKETKVEVK